MCLCAVPVRIVLKVRRELEVLPQTLYALILTADGHYNCTTRYHYRHDLDTHSVRSGDIVSLTATSGIRAFAGNNKSPSWGISTQDSACIVSEQRGGKSSTTDTKIRNVPGRTLSFPNTNSEAGYRQPQAQIYESTETIRPRSCNRLLCPDSAATSSLKRRSGYDIQQHCQDSSWPTGRPTQSRPQE
ncbi:hypothetical protein B0H11DRAFT_1914275 [Mycena galericulata]|nr:hypothetical protein B0H11DRAFT_1914275 [Mycena galericulata]